ncbi:uncharacterized protein DUF4237 [Aquimarina sp. MAR_2010_214]|uniref:glycohydrolase toxin TNT-related protein n=1 Tax=Aquimarina sp. MAR_2010_214 TaxID=1250026 RepID=UPI000C6FDC69|nr:glycohydrolase toxin TNT-related protein [Aquimarina sp. MAR_2010_214]PKV52839.1 uncharacterized protein DUF4237 [Aquimarina sp. MAR_2010_214]
MFKKFFGKKIESTKEDKLNSPKIDWHINESILTFNNGDAYMHYYNKEAVKNTQDPAWQNQGIYFWNNDEIFEKKSLPDEFLEFEKKIFLINEIPEYITIAGGKAMPWFGKPGGGDKYFFRYENNPISIEEAEKLKILIYFEYVEITENNTSILNDRDNYIFQLDKSVNFKEKEFYYEKLKVSLSELYHKELLKVLKIK